MTPLHDAALSYARRGWPVIPLHTITDGRCSCGKTDCTSPGKHPRTAHGLKDASTDPEVVAGWWKRWPDANVGIVTGAVAGLVALDIDPRHGGHDSWAAIEHEHGPTGTLEAATGGGGRHLIFAHPGGKVPNRANVRPGIDVRGDGGYIVAAPSIHASGGVYTWPEDWRELEPAPLPDWLHELLTRPTTAETSTGTVSTNGDGLARLLSDAGRYVANAKGTTQGYRNLGAFSMAGHLAAFVTDKGERLTEAQILDLMRSWNHKNTPPLDDAELTQAVRSGMTNGTARAAHTVHTKARPKPTAPAVPFRPFPVEALPDPVRVFVEAVAKSTGTDPAFAALAALVVLAGCIGNRVAALVKGGWVEAAVLWGVLVGNSGTTKSPVLKATTRALFELYKGERRAFADAMREHQQEVERYAVRLTAWKAEQRKGPPTDPPEAPEQPREERLVVSDVTVEKLGCLLQDNPLGLLLVRDELAAWIGSFDRYAAGGKGSDCPAWLSMYDAAPVTIDRKSATGTIFCERAAVSVLGSIQPGTLARVFGTAEREAGLLGRVLLAYPPNRPALWTDEALPDDVAAGWRDLLAAMLAIEPGVDDDGDPRPRYMPISDEAKPLWVEWHNQHARETADVENEDLAAHFAKLKGACVRFALVLECVNVATGHGSRASIGADAMSRAIQVTEWFKHEARRVYRLLSESDDDRDRRLLVELIERKGGELTARELQQSSRLYPTADDAETALAELVKDGVGRWEERATAGRPKRVFRLDAPSTVYGSPENPNKSTPSVDVDTVDSPANDEADGRERGEI